MKKHSTPDLVHPTLNFGTVQKFLQVCVKFSITFGKFLTVIGNAESNQRYFSYSLYVFSRF